MPETKRPLKVFLCHASQDKPAVRELSQRLFSEGWIDPWLDEKKLLPGQDWRLKIEEAVETSDIVIICLSSNSVSKEGFVQKELRYAREIALEKLDETIFLIPLRLDDCIVPRGLRFYQWVDYFGENKDEAYSALIESLKLRYEQKLILEEQERVRKEKLERENVERLAREKAAREKVKHDAAEKARIEAEEQAREKAAREKAEQEAEKVAKKKAAKEKSERDAAEKAAREEKERETAKKVARKQDKRESTETLKPKAVKPVPVEEKLIAETSQVVSKEPEIQESQSNPGNQVALWVIGFIVIISIIGLLNSNNNNTPTTSVSTSFRTSTSQSIVPAKTLLPTKTPTPLVGFTGTNYVGPLPTEIVDDFDVEMVLVPAGEFIMGSDKGNDDSKPAHQVYLDAYYIDKYEVTNKLYQACVKTGICHKSFSGENERPDYENYPVTMLRWDYAKTYCEWRRAELPTEAQWEKAARSTGGRTYPWGDEFDCSYANIGDCESYSEYRHISLVGSFKNDKSNYGVYDMAGNVDEWVADWYSEIYYLDSPLVNPLGPALGKFRIVRGGNYVMDIPIPIYSRGGMQISDVNSELGFRCARDAAP